MLKETLDFDTQWVIDNSNTCKTLKSTEVIRGILQCALYVQIFKWLSIISLKEVIPIGLSI